MSLFLHPSVGPEVIKEAAETGVIYGVGDFILRDDEYRAVLIRGSGQTVSCWGE